MAGQSCQRFWVFAVDFCREGVRANLRGGPAKVFAGYLSVGMSDRSGQHLLASSASRWCFPSSRFSWEASCRLLSLKTLRWFCSVRGWCKKIICASVPWWCRGDPARWSPWLEAGACDRRAFGAWHSMVGCWLRADWGLVACGRE